MFSSKDSLMDQSKARPGGPVDWNRFQTQKTKVGLGEGRVNSNYLQETREQDPWPEESSGIMATKAELSQVCFIDPETLQTNQKFRMSCQVLLREQVSSLRVTFELMSRYNNESGEKIEESLYENFEGFLPSTYMLNQLYTIEAEGKLYSPNIPAGTAIEYWLIARHPAAMQETPSSTVTLHHKWPVHVVEVPDLLFHHNGVIPCLDEQKWFVQALATALQYGSTQAPEEKHDAQQTKLKEELVILGHTDTSGDCSYNFTLSQERAQVMQSFFTQDVETWKSKAVNFGKVEDYQRILKTLFSRYQWPCDPGSVDNQTGPRTQTALKNFQQQANHCYQLQLTEDGIIGPCTWGAIHRVICGFIAKTLGLKDPNHPQYPLWEIPRWGYAQGNGCYGCGESFPVDSEEKDHYRSQENRRVELIFMPIGLITLTPPKDQSTPLQKEECDPYNPLKVCRIPISLLQVHKKWFFSS